MKQIYADNRSILTLGRRGEDLARQVVFDVTEWQSLYGPGVAELIYRRPGDDRPHVMEIEQEGALVLWTITDWHTATSEGEGECELRYYPVEGTVKSKTWRTYVEKAMDTPSEEDPPDPETGWVESVLQAGAEAKGSAAAADKSAQAAADALTKAPMVGDNGNWWIWDAAQGKYIDSGTPAQGPAGYTPEKGTDYWTPADKAEIVEEVAEQTALVSYNAQTPTESQKAQARKNIGAAEIVVNAATEDKLREFTALFNNSGDVESFIFFTDPHLLEVNTLEAMQSNMETYLGRMKDYYEATPTSFVMCGGDWIGNSNTMEQACFKLGLLDGFMRKNFHPYYPVLGNHDTNYQGVDIEGGEAHSGTLTNETVRNLMFRENGNLYYSFKGQNSTFYVFESGSDWDKTMNDFRWEQVDWFAKKLIEDDAQHSAIAIHIFSENTYVTADFASNVLAVAQAYNNKTTLTLNGVSYDFSAATGRVEFLIAGHTHGDNVLTVNDIPIIVTTNMQDGSTPTFDLCMADYTNRKMNMVRVGSGESRTVDLHTAPDDEVILIRHNISGSLLQTGIDARAALVSTVQTGDNAVPYNYSPGEVSPYYPVALPRGAKKLTVTCPGMDWTFCSKYVNGSGSWSNYISTDWQENGATLDIDSWPTHYHMTFKKTDGSNFETNADVRGITWTFE